MAHRQNLQMYERSDPQGYNNWGRNVDTSTPSNRATSKRHHGASNANRPPLSRSGAQKAVIYNSFLANYGNEPSSESRLEPTESRMDPPSSAERSKRVLFSKQLEIHEKQAAKVGGAPATPILRAARRGRHYSLAPTPVNDRAKQFSGRDPTPRSGHRSVPSGGPEKKKTISDILCELTNTQTPNDTQSRSGAATDPPLNRSRRPRFSDSKSPRNIFSKMAQRATKSEKKAPKESTVPGASQVLLHQARLNHPKNSVGEEEDWDISQLFPSTPQDTKVAGSSRVPSSIQELLSQTPPPPPPRSTPDGSTSNLKAFESRKDHWDAPDLYSDSWNQHLQDKSPSSYSTESQDVYLISRYHPKSSDDTILSPASTVSDIRPYHFHREEASMSRHVASPHKAESRSRNFKTNNLEKFSDRGISRDYQHGDRETVLGAGDTNDQSDEHQRRSNLSTKRQRFSIPQLFGFGSFRPSNLPFQQLSVSGTSFEDSVDLNRKVTADTSESDSDDFNAHHRVWRSVDEESDDNQSTSQNFSQKDHPQYLAKRIWTLIWLLFCLVILGLAISIPTYYKLTGKGQPNATNKPGNLSSFDRCVKATPNQPSNSPRYTEMRKIILGTLEGEAWRVDETGSPQRKALCWISDVDTHIEYIDAATIPAIVQRYTLGVLYYSLVIDGETSERSLDQGDYLSSSHECEWGVVMCALPDKVTALLLADKLLTGSLPSEIANLVDLSFLELSLNNLSGELPTSIEKLTLLEYFAVAFNAFSGSIPTEIGALSKLEFLNMRSSQVHGKIPTELGGLSQLETLLLEGNWLSGTIPEHLGNLGRAQQMSFRKNYLTGRISDELCELRDISLTELKVDSWIECDCCTT